MQRSDDTAQALSKRLEGYHAQTVSVKYKASVKCKAREATRRPDLTSQLPLSH